MHADIKGSLDYMKTKHIPFEHRGIGLLQNQARKILEYGLNKGYKTTAEFTEAEIDNVLGWEICYKTNQLCKYKCNGLCRDAC